MSEATNKHDKFISALAIGGASLPLTEGALVGVAHGGIVGGILALGASGIVWLVADEMAKHGRGIKLSANAAPTKRDKPAGEHGVLYRVFNGRDVREDEPQPQPKEGQDEPQKEQVASYQYLNLGEVFQPHLNQVLSNRIAVLGMPNAGKTNTVSVLCEELGKRGVPLVVFDSKPEYAKLCARPFFVNPYRVMANNVNPQNAFEFGRQVMQDRLQVVVDLTSYGDSDVAAEVMIGIVNGIWSWEYALPNDKRVPVTIVLDEAHLWLPQQANLTDVSKAKNEAGVSLFTQLQKAFFKVINLGRSYGIGIIVSTQRPQNIDKRAINPHEWKFLLKANAPNDLKVYEEYGLDGEIARKLDMGQAYIIGPGEFSEGAIYQMRRRVSPDDSKTPGFENLQVPAATTQVFTRESAALPQQQRQSVQDETLTLEDALRLAREHPEIDPMWFMNRVADYRETDDLPVVQQDTRVIRSPYYEQTATSSPTSFNASVATSSKQTVIYPVKWANEAARSGVEVDEVDEVAKTPLTEREKHIIDMFLEEGMNPSQIAKKLSGVNGGSEYTKASIEVSEALRKAMKG